MEDFQDPVHLGGRVVQVRGNAQLNPILSSLVRSYKCSRPGRDTRFYLP